MGPPPPEYYGIELEKLTDRQTGLKTLLSHKLCMWVVIKKQKFKILVVCEKMPSGDVFFFLKTQNQSAAGNVIQQIKKKKPYVVSKHFCYRNILPSALRTIRTYVNIFER